MLCIPPGNDRYEFKDGRLALFWRDDEPVLMPSGDTPVDPDTMTVAVTPWASHQDRERLARMVSEPILQAADAAGSAAAFDADLWIKGAVARVRFERLPDGTVRGQHQAPDDATIIFLRPPQGEERPHLVMCSDAEGKSDPNSTCLVFAPVAGQLVTILVVGQNADRAFRVSEEMVAELRSFATPTAP